MFGLVDYEDEEDDMPINFGGNGKDGGGSTLRQSRKM